MREKGKNDSGGSRDAAVINTSEVRKTITAGNKNSEVP